MSFDCQSSHFSVTTSYTHVKDELCTYGELLLHVTRIVVPKVLRDKVVRLAHEGHQWVVETKYRLQSKDWWPEWTGVENLVCHECQVCSSCDPPDLMSRFLPPNAPWQDCSVDLLRPLRTEESILVVGDSYSRFLEVAILKSTTSTKITETINRMFARFGVPFSLSSDNGVEHCRMTPLWPQANSEVAHQNRSLFKSLQIANLEEKN